MRISEVAELTGITVSNIRFYEKKGLLEPERNQQSKYREYSPEDIARLKQILLYRKMDLPIETIQQLLGGKTSLEQVLEQQMCILKEKQAMLQGSIDLCEAVQAKGALEPRDIEYYLNYVKDEEAKGRKFAEIEELLDDFTAYTKFDMLAADPIVRKFLRTPRAMRIAGIIWTIALILLPVVLIVDSYIDGNGNSPVRLGWWILMLVALWGPFVRFRRK